MHTLAVQTPWESLHWKTTLGEKKKLQYCTWLFGLILTTNQPSHPVPALGPLQQWNTKHKLDPELSRPSPRSVRIHKQVSRPVPVVQKGVQLWLWLCSLICHAPWCVPRCSSLQSGLQAGFPAGSNQSKQVHAGPRVRHRAVLPCLDGATWKRAVKSIFKCSDEGAGAGKFKLLGPEKEPWKVFSNVQMKVVLVLVSLSFWDLKMNRENGVKMFKVRYFFYLLFLFKGSRWHDLRVRRISNKKMKKMYSTKRKFKIIIPSKN